MPTSIISSDQALTVVLTECIEPNNGRMLWVAQVSHQGQDITRTLFPADDHYFNFELGHWTLNDAENRFYYLPREGRALLIVKEGFKTLSLPYQPLSTLYFWGNLFTPTHLIEIFTGQVLITHLATFTTTIRPITPRGLLISAVLSPGFSSLHLHWRQQIDDHGDTIEVVAL